MYPSGKKSALLYASIVFSMYTLTLYSKPKLAIVFIIDQLAYHYLPKLGPHMHGGMKFLLDNGIVYTKAYYPHSIPATATGHAALNTGTFAKDHGMIDNAWLAQDGRVVQADEDSSSDALVFSPDGLYPFGKSGHNIMVQGISEQVLLNPKPSAHNQVIALSLKSRAAIALAGKKGKAIWFDPVQGVFTSSKAYFSALPQWLTAFNDQLKLAERFPLEWKLLFPDDSVAYQFNNIHNYSYAQKPSLIGKRIVRVEKFKQHGLYKDEPATSLSLYLTQEKDYLPVEKNPLGNQILLDAAHACIDDYTKQATPNDVLLLWISLSSLDLVGHVYGPESLEVIDMIYHLDAQLGTFMRPLIQQFKKDVLFVLTSDHGIVPLPELHPQQGITAQRIYVQDLLPIMNQKIDDALHIGDLILFFQPNQLYLDNKKFKTLAPETQTKALTIIKEFLLNQPGVKHVWTYDELAQSTFEQNQPANFAKNQLYPGRSGQIIFETYPHFMATTYTKGVSHVSPYEWDTHVPLFFYQQGIYERKVITEPVWMLQVANSLASILDIPLLTTSGFAPLPGIVKEKGTKNQESVRYPSRQKMHPNLVRGQENFSAAH